MCVRDCGFGVGFFALRLLDERREQETKDFCKCGYEFR